MEQPEHDNPFGLDEIEDREGEPGHDGTANLSMHRHKNLGMEFDALQRRLHRGEEVLSKTRSLFLVPIEPGDKINLEAPTKSERQRHWVLRTSANTCSAVRTSSGFCRCAESSSSIAAR